MAGVTFESTLWGTRGRVDFLQICDRCQKSVWGSFFDEDADTSEAFDRLLGRNGWHEYFDGGRGIDLCPDCSVRALLLGEIGSLSDLRIRPVAQYEPDGDLMGRLVDEREKTLASRLLPAA